MLWDIVFWLSLAVSAGIGALYFRDLGDVSQIFVKVKRQNMIRFIRNEYRFVGAGLAAFALATIMHFAFGSGSGLVFWLGAALVSLLYGFPWMWVHLGLRNQKDSARFYPISEAKSWVAPHNSVVVMENGGVARAYPDAQIMLPHLAGNAEGLNGENVIMTYCGMANLGIGYAPEVEGEKLDLEVLAQHGNNLILRDNKSGEPIQQIYGFRERDAEPATDGPVCPIRPTLAMKPWPTFRMTFRGFEKAYPEGTVFINKPSSNPLLRLFDMITETVISASLARHHREAAPVMDNMSHFDDRLHNKAYVWGVNLGDDAVCFTDDFVMQHDRPINSTIGDRAIVVAWDPVYESLGAWWNDSGAPIHDIDFFGKSDRGQLNRVEQLKPGMFWHVWVEFFPNTDINRVDEPGTTQEVA